MVSRFSRPTGRQVRCIAQVEARLAWRVASVGADYSIVGELWNAFLVVTPMDKDITKDDFEGFNWLNYGAGSQAALWLVRSAV